MERLKNKKFFLLDMDGTIYLDDDLFEGTLPFLEKVREKGGKYLFLTNNSSKSADDYVEKLARLGVEATAEDFLTSTEATVVYIKENYPDKSFYCVGTKSFVKQIRESGIKTVDGSDEDCFGVILSNDNELNFEKITNACILLLRGAEYIATNPDWVCPTSFGSVPDCGAFAEMLEHATGRTPYFIGKPRPEMLHLAMKKFGFSPEETLMIGDRVYTDIASGVNAGVDTVFVLSGEGVVSDIEKYNIKPSYIMKDIGELCEKI